MRVKKVIFYYDDADISFMTGGTFFIPTPFIVGIIHLNIRLIHYVMNRVLFPSKNNFNHINKSDIPPICFFG